MRQVKIISILVLLVSIAAFVGYNWEVLSKKDNQGPGITLDQEEISVSVFDTEEVLLQGITASDKKDGDVTDSLVVESISGFVEGNKRYINYAAFDSDNHVSKISRKAIYTDYVPIRFDLEAPLRFPVNKGGNQDVLGIVHAWDCMDGDISDRINFSADSEAAMYEEGEYPVILVVSNSAGDTEKLPVTISVYDSAKENAAPKIALSSYLVYTGVGEAVNPRQYLETVNYKGTEYEMTGDMGTFGIDISDWDSESKQAFQEEQKDHPSVSYDMVEITDQVDYQTPGVYEIKYALSDTEDNTGYVKLVVVVEEA